MAGRAEKARTLALARHSYRGPADPARQRGAVVDVVVLLEITRGAVRVHEVAQARPAGGERGEKRVLHGRDQSLAARAREAPGARARMDARPEQAFVRVDVPDSDHDVGVHQQLLDADIAAARGAIEKLRGEALAERLDSEAGEQGVAGDVPGAPQHHAEAARIAKTQRRAAENEIQMIVLAWGRLRVDHAQAPRHAQMHDERAAVALEQQILATPRQPFYQPADDEAREVPRHAPAQIGVAHGDARDGLAEHERLDAAACDLDFGQLRH